VTYEFEGFRLDADRQRLLAAPSGDPIHVSPKALETLIYLVERRGELVEKDALMKAIWPRVVVEENNLDRNISTLRRALGERAGENRFIVTVPGRGYRFVAEVTTATAERAPAVAAEASESRETGAVVLETTAPRATWRRFAVSPVAAVAVAFVLAATLVWLVARTFRDGDVSVQRAAVEAAADGRAVRRASIAVMPFANRTGDPSLRNSFTRSRAWKGSPSPRARPPSPIGIEMSTFGRSRAISASRPCSKAVWAAPATSCA
jgi:DNA-binding winged helix-turn-helix (wHTH) protein